MVAINRQHPPAAGDIQELRKLSPVTAQLVGAAKRYAVSERLAGRLTSGVVTVYGIQNVLHCIVIFDRRPPGTDLAEAVNVMVHRIEDEVCEGK